MCRGGPRRLGGYGDLTLCARAAGRGLRVGSMCATDEALAVGGLAENAVGSLAPRRRAIALPGKAIPHRPLAMNSR